MEPTRRLSRSNENVRKLDTSTDGERRSAETTHYRNAYWSGRPLLDRQTPSRDVSVMTVPREISESRTESGARNRLFERRRLRSISNFVRFSHFDSSQIDRDHLKNSFFASLSQQSGANER
jgi:hypothetical protein